MGLRSHRMPGFLYAIQLPANDVLQAEIEHLLTRPVGRPPRKPIVWFGLQPGQFSAASGPSQKNQTLVASQPIDQTNQDRSEGGSA